MALVRHRRVRRAQFDRVVDTLEAAIGLAM
jgi:hypothetical protein